MSEGGVDAGSDSRSFVFDPGLFVGDDGHLAFHPWVYSIPIKDAEGLLDIVDGNDQSSPLGTKFAAEVRAEIVRQGLRRGPIAAGVGMSPSGFSRRLSGSRDFTLAEAEAVSGALGLSLMEMIARAERQAGNPSGTGRSAS
ncbi:hypothetical protein BN12_220030 [Nostocoides japonicum T1-X7]|uniref:HTH cro/C1-type domain-containing protein n=1 Tax=Nostocoides japonicum T1-X7 TaxID=1194083 RepID=A0A077LXY1_9MICO|nr:helix-turn-helix transcriptional regulator [Tetrasphaera japonica]CCH77752.1 hypothetical protein BN12_220030 [Tetrasphaera japonica T1-X7]